MSHLIGFDPNATFAALGSKAFGLGNRTETFDGKEFVFLKASATINQYDVITFGIDYSTLAAPVTTTNGLRGNLLAVAPVAVASGSYFWAQVKGPCTMNVLASCVANVRLNTTATAGSPDDDGTSTTKAIQGMYLTTTRGGTAGSAPGELNYPFVDATL